MATDKSQKSAASNQIPSAGTPLSLANIDWRAQPVVIAALYGELLSGTADLLRKQADLLTALAGCKDFSQVFDIQTSFAQSVWSDAFRGAQKSFTVLSKSLTGPSQG